MRASASVLVALLLASTPLASCVTRPRRGAPRPPAAPDAAWTTPGAVPAGTRHLREERSAWRRWDVALPSTAGADRPSVEREPILLTWWEPTRGAGPRPAVVVSPILGSETLFVDAFAERFAREGWHALLVRRPEVVYDAGRGVEQVEERLAAAVRRQVEALDWLLARSDVDPSRVASFGISAGGIQGAMVAGADPRYAAHVIALAGGPLADVFVDSDEERLERLVDAAVRREGVDRETLRARLRAAIRTDPLTLAARVPPDRVLLVLARFDRCVPYALGCRLEEALGRPETIVLPSGHYASLLFLPFLKARVLEFLRARLGEAPAGPGSSCARAETGAPPGLRLPSHVPLRRSP